MGHLKHLQGSNPSSSVLESAPLLRIFYHLTMLDRFSRDALHSMQDGIVQ